MLSIFITLPIIWYKVVSIKYSNVLIMCETLVLLLFMINYNAMIKLLYVQYLFYYKK